MFYLRYFVSCRMSQSHQVAFLTKFRLQSNNKIFADRQLRVTFLLLFSLEGSMGVRQLQKYLIFIKFGNLYIFFILIEERTHQYPIIKNNFQIDFSYLDILQLNFFLIKGRQKIFENIIINTILQITCKIFQIKGQNQIFIFKIYYNDIVGILLYSPISKIKLVNQINFNFILNYLKQQQKYGILLYSPISKIKLVNQINFNFTLNYLKQQQKSWYFIVFSNFQN
eukprot:TRINITY_DN3212_c0_g1_i2.p3 TRINITY_DN3212_c0_g1~~TRINITY_DN3212_c0_g1_i2.p3  ORF type:complete len:225 (-),score=-5.56 TRINITY_DN3212_c0_g1_i2:1452-2126(-)